MPRIEDEGDVIPPLSGGDVCDREVLLSKHAVPDINYSLNTTELTRRVLALEADAHQRDELLRIMRETVGALTKAFELSLLSRRVA